MKRILVPTAIICLLILGCFMLFPNIEAYFSLLIDQYSEASKSLYAVIGFLILSSDFLLPIPSSIIMFSNGWILGFLPGFCLSLLASMCSTVLAYWLGKTAKQKVNNYYSTEEIQQANNFLNTYGEVGLILSRGIPILSEATAMICGNMGFNLKNFLIANLLGYLPVCGIYAYLGSIAVNKDIFLLAVLINILLAGIFWFTKDFLLGNRVISK